MWASGSMRVREWIRVGVGGYRGIGPTVADYRGIGPAVADYRWLKGDRVGGR
jgi:hypothetical protein